jgi:hypothetical protein
MRQTSAWDQTSNVAHCHSARIVMDAHQSICLADFGREQGVKFLGFVYVEELNFTGGNFENNLRFKTAVVDQYDFISDLQSFGQLGE